MASFSSCHFLEESQDGYPSYGKRDVFSIKQLPAGNTPAVLEIGMDVQRASIAALVMGTELAALYDQVLESGTLVMDWETHTAFLESMGEGTRVGMEDLYETTLNFIRL